ncbi:cytochrome c biogenesis CcdA family protein [Nocardioides zeae]|uniref:Cytochrome c biogenesis CcdA family protein n=1 Tax=Nocardioides imazamoxiresistens TaxID=3231893 RepID=A0ABU3Q0B9_9ACTN|nr:cytochrome c biogenesis CcdA family protein [Nocardioides zeae]MDT9594814.1 cytochrome c biogenesis CcdA family protein [Nocardioides zeae]
MLLAVPVALVAGLVSFFSPCVLPLVPGYLSYATGMSATEVADATGARPGGTATLTRQRRGRLVLGSVLFVLGFATVFVLYAGATASVAFWLESYRDTLTLVLGILTILLGLVFGGWLRLPFLDRDWRFHSVPKVGLPAAPALGFLFGLGWTPCIGPTLGVILTLGLNEATVGRGVVLSAAYALGLGIPFILLALGFAWSMRAVSWLRRHQVVVMRVGGVMMVAVGVLLVTGWWDVLVQELQRTLISDFEVSV